MIIPRMFRMFIDYYEVHLYCRFAISYASSVLVPLKVLLSHIVMQEHMHALTIQHTCINIVLSCDNTITFCSRTMLVQGLAFYGWASTFFHVCVDSS